MSLLEDFCQSRAGWALAGVLTGMMLAAFAAAVGFAACGCDALTSNLDEYPCHDPQSRYCIDGAGRKNGGCCKVWQACEGNTWDASAPNPYRCEDVGFTARRLDAGAD